MNPLKAGGIVNGLDAGRGYFPWQVGVYSAGRFHCGGALIGGRYFVSAAHCFAVSTFMYIRFSSYEGDTRFYKPVFFF